MRVRQIVVGIAVGLSLAAAAGASPGSWHEAGAPNGGAVYTLALGGEGTFYAGTHVGAFLSGDGLTWRQAGTFPGATEDAGIDYISASLGATAFAATDGKLFKTTDAGSTWQRTRVPNDPYVFIVSPAPGSSDIVYAGSYRSRLYRSDDGGTTWSGTSYGGAGGQWPDAIVVSPDDPRTVYVGTYASGYDENAVVLRTRDGGESWTPLNTGLPEDSVVISLALDPADVQTLYAGTASASSTLGGPGIFKTTNGGRKWRAVSSGLPKSQGEYPNVYDFAFDQATPNVLYAATDRGTMKTTDAGKSWRKASGGLITTLVTDPRTPTLLLAGSSQTGVLRSANSGRSWHSANAGLTATTVTAIAVDPARASTVYLGTYESGLAKTVDGGRSWSTVRGLGSRTIRSVAVNPHAPRTLHVAADGRGVLTSFNGGRSWHRGRGLTPTDIVALAIDPQRQSTVYGASDSSGLWRTLNGGASWKFLSNTAKFDDDLAAIVVDPTRTSTLYAAGDFGNAFVSNDAGRTWRRINAGLPFPRYSLDLPALGVTKRGDVFAAVNRTASDTTGLGVYRLKRGAKRWARVGAGLPRLPNGKLAGLRSLAVHPGTGEVYVGTNLGCYELAPRSARWHLADKIFEGHVVRRVAYSPNGSQIYAAAGGRLVVSAEPSR